MSKSQKHSQPYWNDHAPYRLLSKHTKEVVVCIDPKGLILDMNSAAEVFYGWKKNQMLGKNYRQACLQGGFPIVLPKDLQQIAAKETFTTRTKQITNGIERECIWTVAKLTDHHTHLGFMMIGRTLPENMINDSLFEIAEIMPGSFYWKDLNGQYMGCNNCLLEITNLKLEDVIGKVDDDLWKHDGEAKALRCHDKAVIESGHALTFEEKITLKTGQTKYFKAVKIPLRDGNNSIVGIIGNSVDITHQKKSEMEAQKQLSTIINVIPGSLYWKNKEGVYLGCNDFMVRVAGRKNKADIIGKKDEELWPEQAPALKENDMQVMASKRSINLEECVDLPDGRHYFAVVKMPLKDSEGEIVGIIGNSMDITQLKKYQAQLKVEKEKAESANQAKTEFLYNMRHDIRTPFAGLLGISESLEREETDPEKKELLGYVTQSANALLNIMNEILNYLTLEAKQPGLIIKKFSLKDLVNELYKALLSAAHHKNLTWHVRYDETIPAILLGDKLALYQLLMNLLTNAVKFTEKGSVSLKVDLLYCEEKRVFIRFMVKDTGIGIPEDKVNFIFEKFSRVNPSYKGKYEGIGLGLRFVKQLMHEIEDSDIDVESQLGQGSTFICTIPFKMPLSERFRNKEATRKTNRLC